MCERKCAVLGVNLKIYSCCLSPCNKTITPSHCPKVLHLFIFLLYNFFVENSVTEACHRLRASLRQKKILRSHERNSDGFSVETVN